MKKYSMLTVLFAHPFQCLFYSAISIFLGFMFLAGFKPNIGADTFVIIMFGCVLLGVWAVKKDCNRKIAKGTYRKKKSSLLRMAVAANKAYDRKVQSMGDSVANAVVDSFSSHSSDSARQKAQKQADAAARARWDALDRQKKAEWDARDAALRGKDKAANQYQNQADYWRNQTRK